MDVCEALDIDDVEENDSDVDDENDAEDQCEKAESAKLAKEVTVTESQARKTATANNGGKGSVTEILLARDEDDNGVSRIVYEIELTSSNGTQTDVKVDAMTGKYLGVEHWNLRPDIIALSKGFGAGYAPLGAMVASSEIAETVIDAGGFVHGFTYAGNPLACAAGLAVLGEIDRLNLIKSAEVQGDRLKAELGKLMHRYPFIGDVRGKGLLLAFELVSNRETMEPLPVAMNAHLRLVDLAYERGLIIYSRRTRGGRIGDHFMVCPPLIITDTQIGEIMEMLTSSLDAFAVENNLPVSGV